MKPLIAVLGSCRFLILGTGGAILIVHSCTDDPEPPPEPTGPERMRSNWGLPRHEPKETINQEPPAGPKVQEYRILRPNPPAFSYVSE